MHDMRRATFDESAGHRFMFFLPTIQQDALIPLPVVKCRSCKSNVQHACRSCSLCVPCSKLVSFDNTNGQRQYLHSTIAWPSVYNHEQTARPLRTGIFDAGADAPVPVTVEEDSMALRSMKKHNYSAPAASAATAVSDFDTAKVSDLLDNHIYKRSAEKVIGTMNKTAAAFALDRQNEEPREEVGGVNVGDVGGGHGAQNAQISKRAEEKLGAKWKQKVFRYKGEDMGTSEDVLHELLGVNGALCHQQVDHSVAGSALSSLCIEDMLQGMSGKFVASMRSFAAGQLGAMETGHLIGPFANELAVIEDRIGVADGEYDRIKEEAMMLEKMFVVVSGDYRS
jgi:hypothetical protein